MSLPTPESMNRVDRPPSSEWQAAQPRERLKARTLIRLRWLSIGGQLATLAFVRFVPGFDFPLLACLGLIAMSAAVNVGLLLGLPPQRPTSEREAALQLSFDLLQLGGILFLTGGTDNPFTVLLIGPPLMAATTLSARYTVVVAGLAVAISFVEVWSLPLPWAPGEPLTLPTLYRWGETIAVALGVTMIAAYAWRAAKEAMRMELALHAAETVVYREQRLSALGALAAAAAHELGTPLATIAVVAKEMSRESPPGPMKEDAELISSQAQRCRDILRRLAEAPDAEETVHWRLSLAQLLEEALDPHAADERIRVEWSVVGPPDTEPPELSRRPEVVHALTSLIENAADFAKSEVRLVGRYDDDMVGIEVRDDGPGFSPDIFAKLGEPYVTSRAAGENSPSGHLGMGLGLFIAKTLLERSGARLEFRNGRNGGAVVAIRWPRDAIEAPPPRQ
jgi:two-component system sensor histidine kinase RegB